MTVKVKVVIVGSLLILLTCLVGGFFALRVLDYPVAADELPTAMKEAAAVGIPMSSQELNLKIRSSSSKSNLAKVPVRAISEHNPYLGDENPDWAGAAQFAATHQSTLEELRTIAKSGIIFPAKDWDLGIFVRSPEFAQAKAAAKVLSTSARVNAHKGDFKVAADDLKSVHAFGVRSSQEPCLIGLLCQLAIDAIQLRATESCLADAANSQFGLARISGAVFDSEPEYDLVYALRGEAFSALTTVRNLDVFGGLGLVSRASLYDDRAPIDPRRLRRSGEPSQLVQRAYMARTLQFWTKVFTYMNTHPNDLLGLANFTDEIENQQRDLRNGLSQEINRILFPPLGLSIKACLKGIADYRCNLALCRALEFRGRHHRFPANLAQAEIDFIDPFDHKVLRCASTGDTFKVWSIGPDLIDDGGRRRNQQDFEMAHWDIVAAYPPIRSKPSP